MSSFQIKVTDIRSQLPRNGTYLRRPISSNKQLLCHWDAVWRPAAYNSLARYKNEAQEHINRDWGGGARGDGLMYHFKIDNVGEIFWCRDLEDLLWAAGPANATSIHICMDGTVGQTPTAAQAAGLNRLLYELCYKHPEFPAGRGNVKGHKEVMATQCPGDSFGMPLVRAFRGF